jgi:hypothetical protein
LVTDDEKGFVGDMRQERGVCRLSDGEYQIAILPYPGDLDPQGPCGSWMGARAVVKKDGETLFDAPFEEPCQGFDDPILFRVLIRPGKRVLTRATTYLEAFQGPGLTFFATCMPKWGAKLYLEFGYADKGQSIGDLIGSNRVGIDNDASHFQVGGSCALGGAWDYHYVLYPFIPTGEACGAARRESARLVIRWQDKTLLNAPFMEDCGDPETPVIHSVELYASGEPRVNTIPAALFYDPEDSEAGVYSIYSPGPKGEE